MKRSDCSEPDRRACRSGFVMTGRASDFRGFHGGATRGHCRLAIEKEGDG